MNSNPVDDIKKLLDELQYISTEVLQKVDNYNEEFSEKIGTSELVVLKLENILKQLDSYKIKIRSNPLDIDKKLDDIYRETKRNNKYILTLAILSIVSLALNIFFML